LATPGTRQALVLEPEFITPQDRAEKQDCERNAARRWVTRNAPRFAGRHVTILADDLHSYQRLRAALGTRRTFFDDLRALPRYLFESCEHLITFMVVGLELPPERP
jgi:hypothetical protein